METYCTETMINEIEVNVSQYMANLNGTILGPGTGALFTTVGATGTAAVTTAGAAAGAAAVTTAGAAAVTTAGAAITAAGAAGAAAWTAAGAPGPAAVTTAGVAGAAAITTAGAAGAAAWTAAGAPGPVTTAGAVWPAAVTTSSVGAAGVTTAGAAAATTASATSAAAAAAWTLYNNGATIPAVSVSEAIGGAAFGQGDSYFTTMMYNESYGNGSDATVCAAKVAELTDQPNTALLSTILMLGTFIFANGFKIFKTSHYMGKTVGISPRLYLK